jgi:penicillin-binding protein 1C
MPALSPDCIDDGREASATLRIDGLNDGATLARAPGAPEGVRLSLRALGAGSRVQWLLDGRWIGETSGSQPLVRAFDVAGTHELTALGDDGAWDAVRFRLLAP